MPAFPLRRISQSWPRMWRTCGSFTFGQAHGLDELRSSGKSRTHIRWQLGHFGVNRLVQSLDGPRHGSHYTRCGIGSSAPWRGSRHPAQPVNLPEPHVEVVPTRENAAHHSPQTRPDRRNRPYPSKRLLSPSKESNERQWPWATDRNSFHPAEGSEPRSGRRCRASAPQ
jgi:hypothetical protein